VLLLNECLLFLFLFLFISLSTQSGNFWIHPRTHSASQNIICLLWNPKVHYLVHKNPPLVPVLTHMHPVHNFPPHFPKIQSNIIFPSTPRSSEWSFPRRDLDQNFLRIYLSNVCYRPFKTYSSVTIKFSK
jgi:hypothetical protein